MFVNSNRMRFGGGDFPREISISTIFNQCYIAQVSGCKATVSGCKDLYSANSTHEDKTREGFSNILKEQTFQQAKVSA